MRISDWSADVCSSDLLPPLHAEGDFRAADGGCADALLLYPPARTDRRAAADGFRPVEDRPHHHRRVRHQLLRRHGRQRSEEHTSELQSLMRISYAVFCLKKKKEKNDKYHIRTNLKIQANQYTIQPTKTKKSTKIDTNHKTS